MWIELTETKTKKRILFNSNHVVRAYPRGNCTVIVFDELDADEDGILEQHWDMFDIEYEEFKKEII